MLTFNHKYASLFILLFMIEVFIALFMHDAFVRPIFGDFLAVIALYNLFKTFYNFKISIATSLVFVVAAFVEFLQYIHILAFFHLEKNKLLNIIAGNSFSWGDIIAYVLGCLFVFFVESKLIKKKNGN
jgi:Protein of unknown function (DUF2809)